MTAEEWIAAFCARVGIERPDAATVETLLALAGQAAHGSERTAAPIVCWLAGRAGIDPGTALDHARALAAVSVDPTATGVPPRPSLTREEADMSDLWTWREGVYVVAVPTSPAVGQQASEGERAVNRTDVTGYRVETTDGHVGKIDAATYDVGSSTIVVDTGFWIFGKRRLLPAGVVERVDTEDEKVYVSCTKDEIKDAPDYDAEADTPEYRNTIVDYYRRSSR
jgi:hypothetical protein